MASGVRNSVYAQVEDPQTQMRTSTVTTRGWTESKENSVLHVTRACDVGEHAETFGFVGRRTPSGKVRAGLWTAMLVESDGACLCFGSQLDEIRPRPISHLRVL